MKLYIKLDYLPIIMALKKLCLGQGIYVSSKHKNVLKIKRNFEKIVNYVKYNHI